MTTGVLEEECNRINRVFFTYIREKRPYVTMKYAMTMDGKICTVSGKSKWITGEKSRARVHLERHRYSEILVGVNTVAMDNPMLNTRLENIEKLVPESEFENYGITKVDGNFEVRNPVRVICDTNLRTPMDSNIVKTARKYRTVIATCSQDLSKIKKYRDAGCSVVVQEQYGRIDMKKLMNTLYEMGIDSVIVEGGAAVNWSSLEGKIIDSVQTYISPKIFGGITAKTPVSGEGVESPDGAYMLEIRNIEYLGEDILVESEVADCLREL